MQIQAVDRLTPAATALVSRAWIIREVTRATADPVQQQRWVDELVGFEPPRKNGLRNMFFFWLCAITASALFGAIGLPRWWGFVAVVIAFLWLARLLAVRALRWRLGQLRAGDEIGDGAPGRA